jgi:hypothetical protein
MTENLTRAQKLVEEIPIKGLFSSPVGRYGYEVIVVEQVGNGGTRFYGSLGPGESLDFGRRIFSKFTALAVDVRHGRSFPVERAFAVYERGRTVKVQVNVRYQVADARVVAMDNVDPLGELRDKVIATLNRELPRHRETNITPDTIEQIIRSIGVVSDLGLRVEDAEVINFASDSRITQQLIEREEVERKISLRDIQRQAEIEDKKRQEEANLVIQSRQHEAQLRQIQERNATIDLTDIRTLMHHHPDMIPQIFKTFTDREQQVLQMRQNLVTQAIDAYIKQKHALKADIDPGEIAQIMQRFVGGGQPQQNMLPSSRIVLGDNEVPPSDSQSQADESKGGKGKGTKPHIVLDD